MYVAESRFAAVARAEPAFPVFVFTVAWAAE
jgi:hypothetical protein